MLRRKSDSRIRHVPACRTGLPQGRPAGLTARPPAPSFLLCSKKHPHAHWLCFVRLSLILQNNPAPGPGCIGRSLAAGLGFGPSSPKSKDPCLPASGELAEKDVGTLGRELLEVLDLRILEETLISEESAGIVEKIPIGER